MKWGTLAKSYNMGLNSFKLKHSDGSCLWASRQVWMNRVTDGCTQNLEGLLVTTGENQSAVAQTIVQSLWKSTQKAVVEQGSSWRLIQRFIDSSEVIQIKGYTFTNWKWMSVFPWYRDGNNMVWWGGYQIVWLY